MRAANPLAVSCRPGTQWSIRSSALNGPASGGFRAGGQGRGAQSRQLNEGASRHAARCGSNPLRRTRNRSRPVRSGADPGDRRRQSDRADPWVVLRWSRRVLRSGICCYVLLVVRRKAEHFTVFQRHDNAFALIDGQAALDGQGRQRLLPQRRPIGQTQSRQGRLLLLVRIRDHRPAGSRG